MACSEDTDVANVKSMGPSPSSFQQTSPGNALTMIHGEGEDSYSKNSAFQKVVIDALLPDLKLGLERTALPSENGGRVVVVDLGCSSGPNSIRIVSQIVDNLRLRLTADAEFQCYFNDLATNDFNNLFRLLSLEDGGNQFFAAGLPGSFYGRLVPPRYVNLFHSSSSLQWLSKCPDAVLNKNSPAYNGDNIWYRHSRAVAAAYKEQASLDLKSFLLAREAELVPGGLLFFTFFGTSSSGFCNADDYLSQMGDICADLVSEGLLLEEQRKSFNIPVYLRSIEDVNEAIESCGSSFRVLTAKGHQFSGNPEDFWPVSATYEDQAIVITRLHKAVFGGLFEAILTKNACSIFWQRYAKATERRLPSMQEPLSRTIHVVSLIKT